MAKLNLLIGNGELISGKIAPKKNGPSKKEYPYSIERTRQRLEGKLVNVIKQVLALSPELAPQGVGVALFKVHPAFLAKSNLPDKIFRAAGLRTIGSRLAHVIAEEDARQEFKGTLQPTAELYIAGDAKAFSVLLDMLLHGGTSSHQFEFRRIEDVALLTSSERMGYIRDVPGELSLEAVLHRNEGDDVVLPAFAQLVSLCKGQTRTDRILEFRGLTFIPLLLPREKLNYFASFSPLRAIRSQPAVRAHHPKLSQAAETDFPAPLEPEVLSPEISTAIFDGGLVNSELSTWVSENRACEGTRNDNEYEIHGTTVTSAFLFGRIDKDIKELPSPYTKVEHHKVISCDDEAQWFALYEPLTRIKEILSKKKFQFINLSIGPETEIEDGHVHSWTTFVDEYLANNDVLMTVAAGNVPKDTPSVTRIQPPADAVNALTVGSANSDGPLWDGHHESCTGPGRSPGLIKPDGLKFAGNLSTPIHFFAGRSAGLIEVLGGTSFAAPLVLRIAAGVKAATDFPLSALALKALMIHHAERSENHNPDFVGWGRFPENIETVLLSTNNAATVIYQDTIDRDNRIRANIPLPESLTQGHVHIKATFCFTSEVDPAHSINYTRSGLGITFRPRSDEDETIPFFSSGNLYESESRLRRDAHKWETVLSRTQKFPALRLYNPVFDIEYQNRKEGKNIPKKERKSMPYVLVVTISAESEMQIYDRILQKYPALRAVTLRQSVQLKT